MTPFRARKTEPAVIPSGAPTFSGGGSAVAAPVPPSTFPLRVDPFRGVPEVQRWRDLLQRGDWRTVDAQISAVTDPERRELVVAKLAANLPRLPALDAWASASPSQGLLVRGAHGIVWAWEARGAKRGSTISKDTWAVWFERLRDAEADLTQAAALNRNDPTPWGQLVKSGRGIQVSKEELWARYRKATKFAPYLPFTADHMLQGLCRKWSGSHEAMFDFALTTSRNAPVGHPVHRLVPAAVIERRVDCADRDEWKRVRGETPMLVPELEAAAARSIDRPGFGPRPGADYQQLLTRNVFALGFASTNMMPQLEEQLRIMGSDITESPWVMFGGEKEIRRLRALVKLD